MNLVDRMTKGPDSPKWHARMHGVHHATRLISSAFVAFALLTNYVSKKERGVILFASVLDSLVADRYVVLLVRFTLSCHDALRRKA